MLKSILKMAWKEPDDLNEPKPKEPLKKTNGPPDLELFLKNLLKKLNHKSSRHQGPSIPKKINFYFMLALVAIIYGLSGFFIVEQTERAVMTRFGKFYRVYEPGLHWMLKFIDTKFLVRLGNLGIIKQTGSMLTQDENLVQLEMAVHFEITDPPNYLFKEREPNNTLKQAAEAILRQVVGHSTLNEVLNSSQNEIANALKIQLQSLLQSYAIGIKVVDVVFQPAKIPDEVKGALEDLAKATEEEKNAVAKANVDLEDLLTKAQAEAQSILEQAKGNSVAKTLEAKGRIAYFNLLLPTYLKAPERVRKIMLIEALEKIYDQNPKWTLETKLPSANHFFFKEFFQSQWPIKLQKSKPKAE